MAKRQAPTKDESAHSESSEYERFEELARRLLKVSKKDLDEARAREDADK